MGVSAVQLAKRLVSLLLALAQQYAVHIQLRREDDDSRVEAGPGSGAIRTVDWLPLGTGGIGRCCGILVVPEVANG